MEDLKAQHLLVTLTQHRCT